MVGIAQLVSAPDCGSGGPGFESLYPPCRKAYVGLSPSGKAQDFDSCITLVRIQLAQDGILAQSVEHLTFNQGVPSSSLGWITTNLRPFFERRTAFCLHGQLP